MGGQRERGGEIELCFRDSLFLARKKAQTRVACQPACRARGEQERRRREFGNGMETFCGQNENEGFGGKKAFLPPSSGNAFFPLFPRPPRRSAAKSSPDHICIEWRDAEKTGERDPKCGMEPIGTMGIGVAGCDRDTLHWWIVFANCLENNNNYLKETSYPRS